MNINALKAYGQFAPIEKPAPIVNSGQSEKTEKVSGGKSFSEMFGDAIKEVNDLQSQADKQIEGVTLGRDGATTHGAMIALEKADVAFQLMNNIRARIIRAYEDVIRTAV